MSFFLNNVLINTAYFNGSEVSSIYYNDTLVWNSMPEFEELEYIQSNGAQYIDTEYKPNNNTRVVMDFQVTAVASAWAGIFSGRNSDNSNDFCLLMNASGVFRSDFNTSRVLFDSSISPTARHQVNKNGNVCVMDNTYTVTNTATTFSTSGNLVLCAINSGGTVNSYSKMKIYSCQIYDNGVLVRDFIPAKLPTGQIGLMDKVTKKFYGNKGAGSFSEPSAFEWVGWSSATWEDVYNLTKAKQSGTITAWPDDVVLGATKALSLSTAVLGTSSTTMRIIGLDHDASGTITFQTVNTLSTKTKWTSDTGAGLPAYYSWDNSQVRVECQNFYNYCEAKPYIKTVSKKTYYIGSGSSGYLEDFTETVFLLSQSEVFYSGLSEGSQYGYYDTEVPNKAYWLRSTRDGSYKNAMKTTTDGDTDYSGKTTTEYISPAFVIG